MPADHNVPLLAADLVDALERHVQADPRIITAHVQGSPPTEIGDLYADVLLFLGCDSKDTFDTIIGDAAAWLAPAARIVLAMRSNGGWVPMGMLHCITEDGLRLDIAGRWAPYPIARPHGRILKESPGGYKPDVTPIRFHEPRPDSVLESIQRFWCAFSLIGRAINRDAVAFGYLAYLDLYRKAHNVLAQRNPARVEASFQNIVVTPEDDRLLCSVVQFDSLTPETLAREYLKLGHLISTHGPAICQLAGVQYPLALQEAVTQRVRNELQMHNLPL